MNTLQQRAEQILRASGMEPEQALREAELLAGLAAPEEEERVLALAHKRAAGAPMALLTGKETFMGLTLLTADQTLAPRAETELLGQVALSALRGMNAEPWVIDMCCGSGNLACALASHVPTAQVWAADLTGPCVDLARRNARHLGLENRVSLFQGDLFAALPGSELLNRVDLIVCNPPYISQGKLSSESAMLLEHEPREAFDGGPYGISIHQRALKEGWPFLKPGGLLMFEVGLGQDRQVAALFKRHQGYADITTHTNEEGQARVVSARKILPINTTSSS